MNYLKYFVVQIQDTALDHAQELVKYFEEVDFLSYLKSSAHAGDQDRLEEYAEKFTEYADHVQDVRKNCDFILCDWYTILHSLLYFLKKCSFVCLVYNFT